MDVDVAKCVLNVAAAPTRINAHNGKFVFESRTQNEEFVIRQKAPSQKNAMPGLAVFS